MKTFQFFMLITVLIVIDMNSIQAQSKKEVIESLTVKTDSLNKLLKSKTESLHKLELTLAKMEGASEANKSMFQLYDSRTDSLSKSLNKKDSLINQLKEQLTQLKTSLKELNESKNEIITKNETLQAELDTYKQNTEPVATVKKDTKAKGAPVKVVSKEKTEEQVNSSPASE